MPPPLGSQPGDTYPLLRLLVLLRFLLYLCLIITDSVTDVNTKMTYVTQFQRFNNKTVLSKSTPCRISVTLSHSKRCETSVILTKHTVGQSLVGRSCFCLLLILCEKDCKVYSFAGQLITVCSDISLADLLKKEDEL